MSEETKQTLQWLRVTDDNLPEVGDIVWYKWALRIGEVTKSMSHRRSQAWAIQGVFYFMRVGRPE